MEFDTGERPDPAGSGGAGGGTGAGPPGATASGGEFDLSDPIRSFGWTVRSIVTAPSAFFRGVPRSGSLLNPLAFGVLCSLIAALPAALLFALLAVLVGVSGDAASAVGGIVGAFLVLVLYPVLTVVGLFIAAGIYHLLVLLLVRPSNAGFGATFRAVSYGSLPNALGFLAFIPLLGILVAFALSAYSVVLYVLGVREAHATTSGRAVLIVLIPVAVGVLFGLVVGVIAVVLAVSTGQ